MSRLKYLVHARDFNIYNYLTTESMILNSLAEFIYFVRD